MRKLKNHWNVFMQEQEKTVKEWTISSEFKLTKYNKQTQWHTFMSRWPVITYSPKCNVTFCFLSFFPMELYSLTNCQLQPVWLSVMRCVFREQTTETNIKLQFADKIYRTMARKIFHLLLSVFVRLRENERTHHMTIRFHSIRFTFTKLFYN